jgi:hypothetical protein
LNDVHTIIVGRAFLDLHCQTTYDAAQQIDEGGFCRRWNSVGGSSHFFAFSPELDQAALASSLIMNLEQARIRLDVQHTLPQR